MRDKHTLRRYCLMVVLYFVSEAVYVLERRFGSAPDPQDIQRNIMGVVMVEWMGMLVREMPDDFEFMDQEIRLKLLKAFMYGCNPIRVAEAIKAKKHVVIYCLRYKDGIG